MSRKEKLILFIVCALVLILGALGETGIQNSTPMFNDELYNATVVENVTLVGRVVVSGVMAIAVLMMIKFTKGKRHNERQTKETERTI